MTAKAITERFIQAIDQLCREKGKNVKELCQGLPFTGAYVTNLRRKEQNIGSQFIVALYQKHKINPMWILAGEGEMKIETGKPARTEKAILKALEAKIDKVSEIQGDIIKKMLEAIISVNILPTDVRKKLATLGNKKSN